MTGRPELVVKKLIDEVLAKEDFNSAQEGHRIAHRMEEEGYPDAWRSLLDHRTDAESTYSAELTRAKRSLAGQRAHAARVTNGMEDALSGKPQKLNAPMEKALAEARERQARRSTVAPFEP